MQSRAHVLVFDPLIKHINTMLIAGKVLEDIPSRIAFSSNVTVSDAGGLEAKPIFCGTYLKPDHSAIVSAVVGGGSDAGNWQRMGNCFVQT